MAEQFRTPWLSDVVDLIKRDSTNRIMVGNKEFVLVVRCKDCTWFDRDDDTGTECPVIESGGYPHWNGYCWLGERREDAKEE